VREDEVEATIREFTAVWTHDRLDELARFFHERVVMAPPGGGGRIVGRDAMIESFHQFLGAAEVESFDELALDADVVGDTAIATLRFRIKYRMGFEAFDETGTELYVLEPSDAGWRIVWRTQLPA